MKKRFLLLALLISKTLVCAQEEMSIFPEEEVPVNPLEASPNTQVVILDSVDFAFDMYRALQKGTEGNFTFSPYAISSAMAMVFNGTGGTTQNQMLRSMHFKVKLWYLNDAFNWLSERYTYRPQEAGSDILLSMSNALWLQRGTSLKPEFQSIIEAFYLTPIRFSNFALYPGVARSDINSWIRERTKGRVSQLFEPKDLSKDIRMLLISATYLRAKWSNQFDPRVTRGTPFFPEPGKTIIVPTMIKTSIFSFLDTPEFSIIELPYSSRKAGSKKLSMVLILPKQTFGLAKVAETLTGENFQSTLNLMTPRTVIVSLPKFSLNSSYQLNGVLSSLGMPSLFKAGADLTAMTDDANLYLDEVYHRSMISNDEAGSDAGNPYAVSLPPLQSELLTNPTLFTANHPFLFAILDVDAKTVLFMGRINHP